MTQLRSDLAPKKVPISPQRDKVDFAMLVPGNTGLFGVIGDPIAQIRTPDVINPIFAEMGENIIAVPLHVGSRGFEAAWRGFRELRNLVGFGVTLPHKHNAAMLSDRLAVAAERVGVVNAVRREPDGKMTGALFDGIGFVSGLAAQGYTVSGQRVLIIGAGGAAAAIAFALAEAGATGLAITNRTLGKARTLTDRVNTAVGHGFASVVQAEANGYPIIINATSLGLQSDDPLPIDPSSLSKGALVAEVVANPETTRLLEAAAARGCRTHSGIHMVHHQVRAIAEFVCA